MNAWDPWHGCRKISDGCKNCYIFRREWNNDKIIVYSNSCVAQTKDYNKPMLRNKEHIYCFTSLDNPIYICTTSDFFIEDADHMRKGIWNIIFHRRDLEFKIMTRRIERFEKCIPENWCSGYHNVTVICVCENQKTADERLSVFTKLPIKHKEIRLEPMLERIDIEKYLAEGKIEAVTCGGEMSPNGRVCDYSWILDVREQCVRQNVSFYFYRTGTFFIKDNRKYHINEWEQELQAKKANINYIYTDPDADTSTPYDSVLYELMRSVFRRGFELNLHSIRICEKKGMYDLRREAFSIIRKNIAPKIIKNDGDQTPNDVNPIHIAQHATATCCRYHLDRWHGIPDKCRLNEFQINYIVNVIMEWIKRELNGKNDEMRKQMEYEESL